MKKILALAAVAALTAGVSAYAANPFSDVTPDDWAFQAVSDLSVQGVVEGYPDGSFKGERNMTRYELAQIIARLMAKEDQLNAEQQATLDKLAGEYADELANLGVRVSNLEKKVGNNSWSGDARMQYQHALNDDGKAKGADVWSGRMRINVQGQVNDQVTVNGRFVNEMDFKGGDDSSKTTMDRINVKWTPNDATYVTIGRQGVALDVTGTFWDEDGLYDGVTAGWDNGKIGIDAGYGYVATPWGDANHALVYENKAGTENWFAKLTGHIGETADVSAFYQSYGKTFNNNDFDVIKGDDKAKVWGVGTSINLGSNFVLDGDYVQTQLSGTYDAGEGSVKVDNPALWTAGLTYGEVDTDKVGSWSLGVHYVDADMGSMVLGNSALDMGDQLGYADHTNVKFWVAKAGVAVQKNVELDAYYNFAAKADEGEDPDDTWGIELNYAF